MSAAASRIASTVKRERSWRGCFLGKSAFRAGFRRLMEMQADKVNVCLHYSSMATTGQRRVARAMKAGGPEVIAVETQDLAPLQAGEALVRVEAVGLNHVETLARSGEYSIAFPFPYAVGFEGAGTVVAVGRDVMIPIEARVC